MRDIQRDRSIRNIPITNNHRRVAEGNTPPPPEDYDDYENDERGVPPPRRPQTPRRRGKRVLWLCAGALFVCAVAGLLLSTVFEGAQVVLTPKTVVITEPKELIAEQSAAEGTFVYKTITASQTASTSLTASGTQHVSRTATGLVTISNVFSAEPQVLAANTRLAVSDGKIYRIKQQVSVPGSRKQTDGTITAGTVTVSVTADKPGAEYNQPNATALSIVGFKGDPKYTKITAQAKGAIEGGFVGGEPAVSPADEAAAQNELKRQLDSSIRSIVTLQIPTDYIGVNGTLSINYTDISEQAGPNNTVSMSEGVTATVAMIKVNDVAVALAKQVVKDYAGDPISLGDLSKVVISLKSGAATSTGGELKVAVTGTPVLVWQIDTEAIKSALLGKDKAEFPQIIKGFEPSVAKAQASIRPFWKASFPSESAKMKVSITQ